MDDQKPGVTGRRFAANLRAARERAGLSQADLAAKMAAENFPFHQQTVDRIEKGTRRVSIDEAPLLASAVGSTVDALFRPRGLALDAAVIAAETRDARGAYSEAVKEVRRFASITDRLGCRIAKAEAAGHAEALASELAAARRVIALTLKLDTGPEGDSPHGTR